MQVAVCCNALNPNAEGHRALEQQQATHGRVCCCRTQCPASHAAGQHSSHNNACTSWVCPQLPAPLTLLLQSWSAQGGQKVALLALVWAVAFAAAPAQAEPERSSAQLLHALKEALTGGDETKLSTWKGRNPCKKWEGVLCQQGDVMGM